MSNLDTLNSEIIKINEIDAIWDCINTDKSIQYFWLGRQPYKLIWEFQKKIHSKIVDKLIPGVVLLLEHDHVYTLGKNANCNYLLDSKPNDAEIVHIDRGGEVTYHGKGQLVGYPILDLHKYKMSVTWYMRSLENVIIHSLKKIGLNSNRKNNFPGVWIDDDKICAMGVRLSRWVTMHGFALNVNPDMKYFDGMIPCGLLDTGVTSIYDQGLKIEMEAIIEHIIDAFTIIFKNSEYEV